jgi:hypothetical protein
MVIDDTRIDNNTDSSNYFKNKIDEYDSIIVKSENASTIIDFNYVLLIIQSILKYVKITDKFVGLALLADKEDTNEARKL